MGNRVQGIVWGIVLILLGVGWMASNFIPDFVIDFSVLWPIFLFAPGVGFWITFLTAKDKEDKAGLMIPANILVFLALTFWVNIFLNDTVDQIWLLTSFMYTGSVAIGFWLAWTASSRSTIFVIPAAILTFITAIIFLASAATLFLTNVDQFGSFVVPFILIAIGVFILFGPLWWRVVGIEDPDEWGRKVEQWGKDFEKKMDKKGKDIEEEIEREIESEFKQKNDFRSERVEPKEDSSDQAKDDLFDDMEPEENDDLESEEDKTNS